MLYLVHNKNTPLANSPKLLDLHYSSLGATSLGRVVARVYKLLSTIPAGVHEDNYWFYNITNLAYILITLLHFCWIFTFYAIGQTAMMSVQFLSITSYLFAIVLNRKGYHTAGMLIALLEVNIHQVVAVHSFGWDTGFQNFIPLVALMPFLKYHEKWLIKFSLAIMCMAFYLYIDFFIKDVPPTCTLSAGSISFFTFTNAVVGFILVALWGIVLAFSYHRSVSDLIKKEQELFESQKAAEQAEILRQLEVTARDKEISQLRNVELKNSNDAITEQKKIIEELVSEQEIIIIRRTKELADANKKLVELIQFNAHSLREPLTRLMGAMMIVDYMTRDEFFAEVWPPMGKAVSDLDDRIKDVINLANDTVDMYDHQYGVDNTGTEKIKGALSGERLTR